MVWGKLLLALAQLISTGINWFKEKQLISAGESTEIAVELGKQAAETEAASAVKQAAIKTHLDDNTDTAFDGDFYRKE